MGQQNAGSAVKEAVSVSYIDNIICIYNVYTERERGKMKSGEENEVALKQELL